MPNIIGLFGVVFSSMEPIEAHAAHLRHLSSDKAAKRLVQERFGFTSQDSRQTSKTLSSHVGQALQFHEDSLRAHRSIRPMLQYYCYLNLAVAVILAYRPLNFNHQYGKHGVEDNSHALTTLNLRSVLVRAKRGAVSLFHSLMSGEDIHGREFRLNELVGCIPLVRYELCQLFGLSDQDIIVGESVLKDDQSELFYSQIRLQCRRNIGDSEASLSKQRVEKAMPDLVRAYKLIEHQQHILVYNSRRAWKTKEDALKKHKSTCMRLINYGGQVNQTQAITPSLQYEWHSIDRKGFLPTLSATLLLSFGLASISRYRPALARRIEGSEINVLLDVFVAEADAIVIPAMRNLLYREEIVVKSMVI